MLKCNSVKDSVLKNVVLSVVSAILLGLSFPRYDFEFLAWAGIIPLLFIMKGNSAKKAFLWSWFSGTLFFLLTMNWLIGTINNYGGVPAWISFLILLLLSAYLGLYSGLFVLLTSFITKRIKIPFVLAAPPLWVTLEYLRGHLFSGFPWASLGYSQYKFLHIIQIADITSMYGVSFLIVGVNAGIFEIFSLIKYRPSQTRVYSAISIFVIAALFLSSLIYGNYNLHKTYYHPDNSLNVAVIQGNIPQDLKWDRNFQRNTMNIYANLTGEAGKQKPDIVIWPETAAPFFFQELSVTQKDLYDLAKRSNTFILFGSPAYTFLDKDNIRLFNSAYLISPDGRTLSRYDKMHLVPFGEYVPLPGVLFFIQKMVTGIGDFIPGTDFTVMQTYKSKLGTVICFEVIFPDIVRKFVFNGAEFMTTITNDAWFGRSAAPYQHFSMVIFRAVENRVYFARAANTGISGFISPAGEILSSSPIFTEGYLVQKISPSTTQTFYTLHGDVFAYLCILFAGLLFIAGFKGSRVRGVKRTT